MNIAEFYDELNRHDWYYQFSDDHRSWAAGQANLDRLTRLAQTIEGGPELMKAFSAHYFSGEPWKTEQKPKPERPIPPTTP